jgi:hypothetical protein
MWDERLPIVAVPREGESLYGIVAATAELNQCTIRTLLPTASPTQWVSPSAQTLERVSSLLGLSSSELRARTASAFFATESGRRPPSSRDLWPTWDRLTCPLCRIHRPEFDINLVFACPACGSLLSSPTDDLFTVSAHALDVQRRVIDELRHEAGNAVNDPRHNIISRCRNLLAELTDSVWRVASGPEARALYALSKRQEDPILADLPAVSMNHAKLAAALPLVWDVLSQQHEPSDIAAQWRLESLDWTRLRAQGRRALEVYQLPDLLDELGLVEEDVQESLLSSDREDDVRRETARQSVSVGLMEQIARCQRTGTTKKTILDQCTIANVQKRMVSVMARTVDDPLLAGAALEIVDSLFGSSPFRINTGDSRWDESLQRRISHDGSPYVSGVEALCALDDWITDDDIIAARPQARKLATSDINDGHVAAMLVDMKAIEKLIDWDRRNFTPVTAVSDDSGTQHA